MFYFRVDEREITERILHNKKRKRHEPVRSTDSNKVNLSDRDIERDIERERERERERRGHLHFIFRTSRVSESVLSITQRRL